ncbi:hypothetical protein EJ05DRAFT_540841 [Pseudovirgaria hyperparasitica]|uniref:Uncharacterized protein n=1 Tax=Pseudovirgaria hyperparasitica TaxID=470096 RepID=A0A6A6VY82_9PEZI|nr:uncharacterized protein EJ05DRAFT_540841 [Pseudovirgaria hyperparasitica]KAF2754776.1 hypothetical protein EJ05DRAFT_540841 [Pseudovirgaria hyperparasitica]
MPPPRVKGFFGAPVARDLKWDENLLFDTFQLSYTVLKDILEGQSSSSGLYTAEPLSTHSVSTTKWRSVATNPNICLPTGLTQPTGFYQDHETLSNDPAVHRSGISLPYMSTSFASTISSSEPEQPVSPSCLRHSFKFHERITAAHLTQTQDVTSFISAPSFTSLGDTTLDATLFPSTSSLPALQLHPSLTNTPLSALPSAARLDALQPQTPTATLLVAVLSTTIRSIIIKRKPSKRSRRTEPSEPVERHLIDLLVADQSRAGFKCTFWLPPSTSLSSPLMEIEAHMSPIDIPLTSISSLRRGCIVLIRCIALASYDGSVYAQSLNPYLTKMKTSIDLLVDADGRDRVEVIDPVWRSRIGETREWVKTYVGGAGTKRKAREDRTKDRVKVKMKRFEEDLPPDERSGIFVNMNEASNAIGMVAKISQVSTRPNGKLAFADSVVYFRVGTPPRICKLYTQHVLGREESERLRLLLPGAAHDAPSPSLAHTALQEPEGSKGGV